MRKKWLNFGTKMFDVFSITCDASRLLATQWHQYGYEGLQHVPVNVAERPRDASCH